MKKIRALLVDDEISAINTLRGMLEAFCPQVEVVGTAYSVSSAVEETRLLKPDMVFLDIEMPPHGTGFDFLEQVEDLTFGVIITTAHPKYAVEAIRIAQPWWYLVKPYSVTDLMAAANIAADKLFNSDHQSIIIPDSRKGNQVLRIRDIVYCEADGITTDIFSLHKDKLERVTASRTLGELENDLPRKMFCRTHHSYLVNMYHIERYERTGRNGLIYLPDGACVSISVLKMEAFEQHLAAFFKN